MSEEILGVTLVAYALQALFLKSRPRRQRRFADVAVGTVTGLIAGATGVFVVPAVPYFQSLGLGRDEFIQALGLSFTVSTIALGASLAQRGALAFDQIGLSAAMIVPALLGMWLGQSLRQRISTERFRRIFLGSLLPLGTEMMIRPFF